ncbi:MAG: xanthine dehydrogenase family protein molybdopterin-binding subunit [Elusimicrobiota bacterium]
MNFKYVGKSVKRPDAITKTTGRAVFLDDIRMAGLLHIAILTPEYAHARILSMDTSEAEKCEGVVKVITGKDCPFKFGDNVKDRLPLAVDRVRYIGEPVAAVVAENIHQAREAARKIKVKYEPLPVYVNASDALKKDAALIHEKSSEYWHLPGIGPIPGTNIADHYVLKKGDAENGFKEADVVVEGEFNYPFGSSAAIEPHGTIALFHEDGTIEIWSSSICPFVIRDDLAHSYNLPVSSVRVHIPEIGGCFGYKSDVTIEQTVAYIASFLPGRPVKWVATRKEDFLSTLLAHGIKTRMKIGAKKDGTLTTLQATIHHSTGAYVDTGVHVMRGATHNCTGTYEFHNCHLEGFSVYTNTTPVGAYRGYGHQETQFAVERLLDILARKINISPMKLREKNYLGPGKITASGEKMWESNGSVQKCARVVQEILFSKPKPAEDKDYYYGRGFSGLMKSPKGAPFSSKGCYLKFNSDGSVSINMGGAEVGQGLRTVVKQIASEVLKISPDRIAVYTEIDTQFSPWEWQTIGSMFTVQGGRAVIRACEKAIAALKQTASQALRCDADMLEYDGEHIFLKHDPDVRVRVKQLAQGYMHEDGITVGEVVQTTSDARLPRYSNPDANGQGSIGVSYTFGAQGCELRVEKKTGNIIIDHFISCFDVGKVINPEQIRGQVVGGVMMALGASLCEELKFTKDGKSTNPHFGKYRFPNIKDIPKKQTVEFIETPENIGPFGARGIGEHPVIGVAPAVLNAIYDATGIDFSEIPVTPEKMKKALDEKRIGKNGAKN